MAHELGHSFQLQSIADGEGVAWGGNGIFEMGAQWMLWQVNPHWIDDETYHWDAFKKNTHKAFLHTENIYRSPYIFEYWSERQGLPFIGELFRQGKKGEDPVMTYKRMQNLSQEPRPGKIITFNHRKKQAGVMGSSESPQQDRQSGAKYTKTVKEKSASKPPKTNL